MFHDRRLLEALLGGLASEARPRGADDLRGLIADAINPLATRGSRLTCAKADDLSRLLLGGAGAVMRMGERAALGPTRARQIVLVHVTTACLVSLELWLPFATMPCGSWQARGPGSSKIDLVPNEPLAGTDLVGPHDFGVLVAHGREGEFPAWITFGP